MSKRRVKLPQGDPKVGTILDIHRGEDSYVRFYNEGEAGLRPIAALKVADLHSMFPTFREQLTRDAYFTLNSFYREGTNRTRDLRYLNTCYADCDYYNARTDRAAAIAGIVRAQDAGHLPPASILADSGRGLWCFYLLESATEPGKPERVYRQFPQKITRYRRVQVAIHKTLKTLEPGLEPDGGAIDASRIARVDGSINTKAGKAGRAVRYWVQLDEQGQGYSYTLQELEDFFGLHRAEQVGPEQLKSWGGKRKIVANVSGYTALHRNRLEDFERLWAMRHGFWKGHRANAAWIYALILHGYREEGRKLTHREMHDRLMELAQDCNPPLSPFEVDKAQESARANRYVISDEQIIQRLKITPEELDQLAYIQANRPPRLKAGPKQKPSERKAERQALILELLEQRFGNVKPSAERMRVELELHGVKVSRQLVWCDYKQLGLTGPQLHIRVPVNVTAGTAHVTIQGYPGSTTAKPVNETQ